MKRAFIAGIAVVGLGVLLSCHDKAPITVQQNMRDAYKASAELYRYVWTKRKFESEGNRAKIAALLNRLEQDFHRVEAQVPVAQFEPGFRTALAVNHDIIRDASARFRSGQVDYARWRLRSLTSSCIGCHTRYQVASVFDGVEPEVDTSSYQDRLEAATYLVATRQFNLAVDELWKLSAEVAGSSPEMEATLEPLKLWLLVQVRVKGDFTQSAEKLHYFLTDNRTLGHPREIIESWQGVLRGLEGTTDVERSTEEALRAAESLLRPAMQWLSIDDEDKNLPAVLRATAILHPLLVQEGISLDTRRRASYLLALAYSKMNVPAFDIFPELYLEQCIREFPATYEARESFELYRREIELLSSGAAGVFITPEDEQKLKELRALAYGSTAPIVTDLTPGF